MNRLLRIADRLTFPQVLAPLAPEAHDLHWSVLDLGEVVPGDGWDLDIPYTEPRVLESPQGWLLTFTELTTFAASVRSSFWLVGASDNVLSRVEHAFREVIEVESGSAQLSTWGRDY